MTQHRDDADLPGTPFDEATDLLEPDRKTAARHERRIRLPHWKPLVFMIAVLLSPVFGLAFGLDFALGVLVVAMAFTTWMAWEGSNELTPRERGRLRQAALLNAILTVAVLGLLIARQLV